MGDSICLDSDFLVDFLRNKEEAVNWVKENEEKNTLATTIINVFELYGGAYKAVNYKEKILQLRKLVEHLRILNFSLTSAEEAGRQHIILEKNGETLEKRDLFIGIIAMTEGFSLKTNNIKHFSRIKGLKIV